MSIYSVCIEYGNMVHMVWYIRLSDSQKCSQIAIAWYLPVLLQAEGIIFYLMQYRTGVYQ